MILLSFVYAKRTTLSATTTLQNLEALQLRASDVPSLTWGDLLELDPLTGFTPVSLQQKLTHPQVGIAGFAVPLTMDHELREFLLVPNALACIHIPAPPANQMVFVKFVGPTSLSRSMLVGPLIIKGHLQVELQDSIHGAAGYVMYAQEVHAY